MEEERRAVEIRPIFEAYPIFPAIPKGDDNASKFSFIVLFISSFSMEEGIKGE